MKYLQIFLWLLFFIVLAILSIQYIYLAALGKDYSLTNLELANNIFGRAILNDWALTKVGNKTQLFYVRQSIYIDFFFIIGYVPVLIMISYHLMQRQKNKLLNEWLRFCFVLAIAAGLLDFFENIILLYDIQHYFMAQSFISSMYVSYPKWALIVVIIFGWVSSGISNFAFTEKNKDDG